MDPNEVVYNPMEGLDDPAELKTLYGLSETDVVGYLRGLKVYLNRTGDLLLVLRTVAGPRAASVILCPSNPIPGMIIAFWSVTGRIDLSREEVESLAPAAAAQQSCRVRLQAELAAERAEREQAIADRQRVEAERIADKDLFEIRGGSGYGHQQMEKGKVYRNRRFGIAVGEPEFLFVLESVVRYHGQDGMTFGVGAEQGHSYRAVCRAAKENEIQEG
jgi:hypothetical protein